MYTESAARRLYLLLDQLRGLCSHMDLIEAWRHVLDVDTDADLAAALARTASLLDAIDTELNSCASFVETGKYRDRYHDWSKWITSLTILQGTGRIDPDEIITVESLQALASLADVIESHQETEAGNSAALEALSEQLPILIEWVTEDTSIDPVFRAYLLERLYEIDKSLRYVRIFGLTALDRQLQGFASDLVRDYTRNPGRWERFIHHPAWKRISEIIGIASKVSDSYDQIEKIIEGTPFELSP